MKPQFLSSIFYALCFIDIYLLQVAKLIVLLTASDKHYQR